MAILNMYGLFEFFEENTLGVGPLSLVNLSGTGLTTNSLNPKDWKVEKEVLVRWETDLYPAKILDISENEQTLLDKREELIKGSGTSEEYGRGRRKKKPVQHSSEDEQCEMPKRKKTEKKDVRRVQIEKLLQQRKQRFSTEKEPRREQLTGIPVTHCASCKRLEQGVKELEEDRQRLTQLVDTVNDMRNMLSELRNTLVREPAISVQTTHQEQATTHSSSPQAQDILDDEVLLGEGLKVSRIKLQRCNHLQPTKLVCDLLGVVFTRKEMATSSLTGQKGSAKNEVKPPLEATSINAIFDYTLKKFPHTDINLLRGAVRNKLNNESKIYKRILVGPSGSIPDN